MKCEHPGCDQELSRRANRRKSNLCRKHALQKMCRSLAYRQRLSEAQQRRFQNEVSRAVHSSAVRRGWDQAKKDPAKLEALRERGRAVGRANKGRVANPEVVARQVATRQANREARMRPRLSRLAIMSAPSGMDLLVESWRKK